MKKKTHHNGGVRITERAECCPLEPGGAAPENTHFHICDLDFSAFKLQERLNKAGEPPEDAEQRVGVWMTAAKARRAKNRACGGAVDVHKIVARSLQKVVMQPTESFFPPVRWAYGRSPSQSPLLLLPLSGTIFHQEPLFGLMNGGKGAFKPPSGQNASRFPHQCLTFLFQWRPRGAQTRPRGTERSSFWCECRRGKALPVVGSHEVPGFPGAVL